MYIKTKPIFHFNVYASGGFNIYYKSDRVRFNWEAYSHNITFSIQSSKPGGFKFILTT